MTPLLSSSNAKNDRIPERSDQRLLLDDDQRRLLAVKAVGSKNRTDENARLWLPMVDYASHYIEQENLEKSTLRAEQRIGSIQNCILEILKSLPGGETQSVLREACKPQPSSSEMNLLLARLVERGCLKRCSVVKNGREYPGFRIPDVPF